MVKKKHVKIFSIKVLPLLGSEIVFSEWEEALKYLRELRKEELNFYKKSKHPIVRVEVKIRLDNNNIFNGELISVDEAMRFVNLVQEFTIREVK